jgi:hypothetical protein
MRVVNGEREIQNMNPNQTPSDDWLEEGLEQALKSPPLVSSPPPKSGNAMLNKEPPATSAQKQPKSLKDMGIGKGGIVRNPTTVHRTQLDNPLTNPRPNVPLSPGVKSRNSSVLDQQDLPPEFGIPGTILTGMDADLEKNAIAKASQPVSALDSAYTKPPAPAPANPASNLSMQSTLGDLLSAAMSNNGTLLIQTPRFVLEVTIT